jgi:hypothetical protein
MKCLDVYVTLRLKYCASRRLHFKYLSIWKEENAKREKAEESMIICMLARLWNLTPNLKLTITPSYYKNNDLQLQVSQYFFKKSRKLFHSTQISFRKYISRKSILKYSKFMLVILYKKYIVRRSTEACEMTGNNYCRINLKSLSIYVDIDPSFFRPIVIYLFHGRSI